jgi:alpha-tubulin suppressor-like RCC1 family protein
MCWGANDAGQVGDPSTGEPAGVVTPGGVGLIQISAGFSHTCAVRADGAIFCWGANDKGELGAGSTSPITGAVRVALPAAAASVSAGQERTCARTVTNVVYCWGTAWTDREDGWEMTRSQTTPELLANAPALGTLSVGGFTTCGADANGQAYCWEANPRGEMGDGTQTGSVTPLRVSVGVDLQHVSSGTVQSCGVATDGAGYCWGDDSFDELGVAPSLLIDRCDVQNVVCSTVPVPVSGGHTFTQISTGLGSHSCGVTTDANVLCWGLGLSGQRGDGTTTYVSPTPTPIVAPSTP